MMGWASRYLCSPTDSTQKKKTKITTSCFSLGRERIDGGPQSLWSGCLVGVFSCRRPDYEEWERCLICLMFRHQHRVNKSEELGKDKILETGSMNLPDRGLSLMKMLTKVKRIMSEQSDNINKEILNIKRYQTNNKADEHNNCTEILTK